MTSPVVGIILMLGGGLAFLWLRSWVQTARDPGRTPESRSVIALIFFCSITGFLSGIAILIFGIGADQ